MIAALHPWTSFVIVPVFALANAGIPLTADALTSPSAVLVGVFAGLVVGKLVGVTAFSWLAVRLGLGRLPAGAGWSHVVGVAAVAGIGFTVSLFITGSPSRTTPAPVGRQDRGARGVDRRRCGWGGAPRPGGAGPRSG